MNIITAIKWLPEWLTKDDPNTLKAELKAWFIAIVLATIIFNL